MFTKIWRESVRMSGFKLNHPAPEDFTICCWQKGKSPNVVWLAYRILLGLLLVATHTYVFIFFILVENEGTDKYKYFIFLTHWTYTLETVLFIYAAIITISAFKQSKKEEGSEEKNDTVPWYYKLYWAIYTAVLSAVVVVTLIYWIKIYDPENDPLTERTIIVHAFNTIFMMIDFALVAHPIRFLHFYCPIVYVTIYLIFSVIYELSGGTGRSGKIPIYNVLDWKNEPKQAFFTTLMGTAVVIATHIFYSLLSMGKMAIRKKYNAD